MATCSGDELGWLAWKGGGDAPRYAFTCTMCAVFGLLSAFAPNMGTFIASRAFVGVGVGGASVGLSLFTEFLPKVGEGMLLWSHRRVQERRGAYMLLFFAMFSIGGVVVAGMVWLVQPHFGWRVAFASAVRRSSCNGAKAAGAPVRGASFAYSVGAGVATLSGGARAKVGSCAGASAASLASHRCSFWSELPAGTTAPFQRKRCSMG